MSDYKEVNRKMWDDKVSVHVDSEFYDTKGFKAGKSTINEIEAEFLGDVKGKTLLHLQCHFGQDTMSLSRMGAQATGLDFSEPAINTARKLSADLGLDTQFVLSDVYDAHNHIVEQFDIVYTSYGTVGWLPDMDRWAKVVADFLKPGGRFVFAEFHPVLWMYDEEVKYVQYPYLKSDPIVEEESGTYAERDADLNTSSMTWNHGISEIIDPLLRQGLRLDSLKEYDYSPHNIFKDPIEFSPGKFGVRPYGNKLPLVYALSATKPE